MSKKVLLDAFYNNFYDFANQLLAVFPDDTDILAYKTSLALIQKTNPVLAIKELHTYLLPYAAMITNRNSDFFLRKDYSEYQEQVSSSLIEKLKTLWSGLSDTNRKIVWDYVNLLFTISQKYREIA